MAFHEMRFPDNISRGARGGPERRTQVVELASGDEERNASWANSRRRYDVAYGIRRADDLAAVVAFFEARNGRLHGFRYKDWADYKSCLPSQLVAPTDQPIGTGNGAVTTFALLKRYTSGAQSWTRAIAKAVAGTVRLALNGVEQMSGWSADTATAALPSPPPPVRASQSRQASNSTSPSVSTPTCSTSPSISNASGRSPRSPSWKSAHEVPEPRAAGPSRRRHHHPVLVLAHHPGRRDDLRLHRP